ncbi:hypothetical protein O3298_10900 [Janthinobacterium sp. SUN137]|nr:hypothetical protein [Janthinobacterium sp. SUN137]
MNVLSITAAPLIPHFGGTRSHPDLPSFEPGDVERWQNWLQEQRLEVMQVWMEDDAEALDIYSQFLRGDAMWALSAWQPCKPNGEKDWFLLAVFVGGDGPCAYFVRRVEHGSDVREVRDPNHQATG